MKKRLTAATAASLLALIALGGPSPSMTLAGNDWEFAPQSDMGNDWELAPDRHGNDWEIAHSGNDWE